MGPIRAQRNLCARSQRTWLRPNIIFSSLYTEGKHFKPGDFSRNSKIQEHVKINKKEGLDVLAGILVHKPPGPEAIIPQSSVAVTEGDCRDTLREISTSSPK